MDGKGSTEDSDNVIAVGFEHWDIKFRAVKQGLELIVRDNLRLHNMHLQADELRFMLDVMVSPSICL